MKESIGLTTINKDKKLGYLDLYDWDAIRSIVSKKRKANFKNMSEFCRRVSDVVDGKLECTNYRKFEIGENGTIGLEKLIGICDVLDIDIVSLLKCSYCPDAIL